MAYSRRRSTSRTRGRANARSSYRRTARRSVARSSQRLQRHVLRLEVVQAGPQGLARPDLVGLRPADAPAGRRF